MNIPPLVATSSAAASTPIATSENKKEDVKPQLTVALTSDSKDQPTAKDIAKRDVTLSADSEKPPSSESCATLPKPSAAEGAVKDESSKSRELLREKLKQGIQSKRNKGAAINQLLEAGGSAIAIVNYVTKAQELYRDFFPEQRKKGDPVLSESERVQRLQELEKSYGSHLNAYPDDMRHLKYPALFKSTLGGDQLFYHYCMNACLFAMREGRLMKHEQYTEIANKLLTGENPDVFKYKKLVESILETDLNQFECAERVKNIDPLLSQRQKIKSGVVEKYGTLDDYAVQIVQRIFFLFRFFPENPQISGATKNFAKGALKDAVSKILLPKLSDLDAIYIDQKSESAKNYWIARYMLCLNLEKPEFLPVAMHGLKLCSIASMDFCKTVYVLNDLSTRMLMTMGNYEAEETDKLVISKVSEFLSKSLESGWLDHLHHFLISEESKCISRTCKTTDEIKQLKAEFESLKQSCTMILKIAEERKGKVAEREAELLQRSEELFRKWIEGGAKEFEPECSPSAHSQKGSEHGGKRVPGKKTGKGRAGKGKGKGKGHSAEQPKKKLCAQPHEKVGAASASVQETSVPSEGFVEKRIRSIGAMLLSRKPEKYREALQEYKSLQAESGLSQEHHLQINLGNAEACLRRGLSLIQNVVYLRRKVDHYQNALLKGGLVEARQWEHVFRAAIAKMPVLKNELDQILPEVDEALKELASRFHADLDRNYKVSLDFILGACKSMMEDSKKLVELETDLTNIFKVRGRLIAVSGIGKRSDSTSVKAVNKVSVACATEADHQFGVMLESWSKTVSHVYERIKLMRDRDADYPPLAASDGAGV